MSIALDGSPRIVVAEQMSRTSVLAIHPTCVTTVEQLHSVRETGVGWADEEVVVVRHQALSKVTESHLRPGR
jgi:hypothetical protein